MAMEMVLLKIVYFLSNMMAKYIMDVQNQKMEVILGAQQKLIEEGDGIFCLGNGVIAIQPALLIKMGLEGS